MTGKNNEDRYAVASFVLDQRGRIPSYLRSSPTALAGTAGEVAAELAVNHLMQAVAGVTGVTSGRRSKMR